MSIIARDCGNPELLAWSLGLDVVEVNSLPCFEVTAILIWFSVETDVDMDYFGSYIYMLTKGDFTILRVKFTFVLLSVDFKLSR